MKQQLQKNVHYFPGHMKKALGKMYDYAATSDIIIEVADARAPFSTRNPLLNEVANNKPRLLLLSKSDWADPEVTNSWLSYFAKQNIPAVATDLKDEKAFSLISKASLPLMKEKREKEAKIGMKPQPVRLLIVGVPNVGKSTLINNLAGHNVAMVANRPGVTRAEQWIKLPSSFVLLDTPGILPMNYPDGAMAVRLAILGSIKEEVLPVDELALALFGYLKINYPTILSKRYDIPSLSSLEEEEVLTLIAKKRGYLLKGGEADTSKAASLLIKEFHDGILGRISLEKPC